MNIFPYQWLTYESEIHLFGINEANENVLLRITGFTPYLYVKLPKYIDWGESTLLQSRLLQQFNKTSKHIVSKSLRYRRPLYYSNMVYKNGQLQEEKVPYMLLAFSNDAARKQFLYNQSRRVNVLGIGTFEVAFYEHNATPILQMSCARNISTSDWVHVRTVQTPQEPISSNEGREFQCFWKSIDKPAETRPPPNPTILSWDIETYSHNPNKFADGTHPDDEVFQISCVFQHADKTVSSYLLTLGQPDCSWLPNIYVRKFRTEYELLLGFRDIVLEKDPNVITGYNIYNFDIPYVLRRAHHLNIEDEFYHMGFTHQRMNTVPFRGDKLTNSSAVSLEIPGRMVVDMMVLVKKDHDLEAYSLNHVSETFLKSVKDPLNHLDIFMCYRRGLEESRSGPSTSLGVVGKYCVKDSALVLDLYNHFQYWISLIEMAKICQMQPAHLFMFGQQLKMFSQAYLYCYYNDIVVESGAYKASPLDKCKGAYVFDPIPGMHDNVVSFDFASLYPSIFISYNIDYTSLVVDETVPDRFCNVIEWSEHVNCACPDAEISKNREYQCAKYRFRWLKDRVGVIPTIIKNLLQARKEARTEMEQHEEGSTMWSILNKRQLAYKISANSMYGAMALSKGFLPFLPGGMSITAIGRESIKKVSQIMKDEYKGQLIYGDTDSNYVCFPHLNDWNEIWTWSKTVAKEVSKHFPDPMQLEFEKKIYTRFLILTKKRYMYYFYDGEREHREKIGFKGVLLKRRDNPKVVRHVYERVARMMLDNQPETDVVQTLYQLLDQVYTRSFTNDFYHSSKSIRGIDEFPIDKTDTTTDRIKYGTYKVREAPTDAEKRVKKFSEKNVDNDEDYYRKQLPEVAQLALRMRDRGQFVESGSRLLYVITNRVCSGKLNEKIEDFEYFDKHYPKHLLDVDYYFEQLKNPMEILMVLVYGEKYTKFITSALKCRQQYNKVCSELQQFRMVFSTGETTLFNYYSRK